MHPTTDHRVAKNSPARYRKPRLRRSCRSCHSDKVKCDARHPMCGRCLRYGRYCAYYGEPSLPEEADEANLDSQRPANLKTQQYPVNITPTTSVQGLMSRNPSGMSDGSARIPWQHPPSWGFETPWPNPLPQLVPLMGRESVGSVPWSPQKVIDSYSQPPYEPVTDFFSHNSAPLPSNFPYGRNSAPHHQHDAMRTKWNRYGFCQHHALRGKRHQDLHDSMREERVPNLKEGLNICRDVQVDCSTMISCPMCLSHPQMSGNEVKFKEITAVLKMTTELYSRMAKLYFNNMTDIPGWPSASTNSSDAGNDPLFQQRWKNFLHLFHHVMVLEGVIEKLRAESKYECHSQVVNTFLSDLEMHFASLMRFLSQEYGEAEENTRLYNRRQDRMLPP